MGRAVQPQVVNERSREGTVDQQGKRRDAGHVKQHEAPCSLVDAFVFLHDQAKGQPHGTFSGVREKGGRWGGGGSSVDEAFLCFFYRL